MIFATPKAALATDLNVEDRDPTSSILPGSDLSSTARKKIRSVIDSGVGVDSYGLIIPRLDREILQKFTTDLLNVRAIIQEQMRQGKHVLYLPGSYDLVHVGHASFIQESVETYCNQRNIKRENLFVVALADEDELISTVKKSASREGELPRPIQSLDLMGQLCGDVSPRLIDLASLPFVDLVGILPAPSSFGSVIRTKVFDSWLGVAKNQWETLVATGKAPEEFKEVFGSLIENLNPLNYGKVSAAYRCVKNNINSEDPNRLTWRIQDWHFMLHQFLGDVSPGNSEKEFRRVISKNDSYADEVEHTMACCGIGACVVDDTVVVSTTKLITQFGWETLKNQKLGNLANLYKQGLIPFCPNG